MSKHWRNQSFLSKRTAFTQTLPYSMPFSVNLTFTPGLMLKVAGMRAPRTSQQHRNIFRAEPWRIRRPRNIYTSTKAEELLLTKSMGKNQRAIKVSDSLQEHVPIQQYWHTELSGAAMQSSLFHHFLGLLRVKAYERANGHCFTWDCIRLNDKLHNDEV